MNQKHQKAGLAAAVLLCLGLIGCSTPNEGESSIVSSSMLISEAETSISSSSSPSSPASGESQESSSVSSAAPEESEEEPRELFVEAPAAGYEPFQEESSGLYQEIQPSEDIPFGEIDLVDFGEGKILFEYCNEKYPGMSGSDEYMMGNIVVYDTASKQYITAGDKWEAPYIPTGIPIIMKSGYYHTSWTEDEDMRRCIHKIDLATGKRTTPLIFEKEYEGGIGSWTIKIDETHFLLIFGYDEMEIYDTETDKIQELPKEIFKNMPVCQQDGKLYEITVPESGKRSEGWHLKSYDPSSGKAEDYGNIAENTYITPGTPFQKYLSEGETLSMYPFMEDDLLFWTVWKDNVPVRFLCLEGSGSGRAWTIRESGMIFFLKDNILYLMDVQTGEIRVLDFGYREKYQSMKMLYDEDGNIVLVLPGQGDKAQQETFYFVPKDSINKLAVPYEEFIGLK